MTTNLWVEQVSQNRLRRERLFAVFNRGERLFFCRRKEREAGRKLSPSPHSPPASPVWRAKKLSSPSPCTWLTRRTTDESQKALFQAGQISSLFPPSLEQAEEESRCHAPVRNFSRAGLIQASSRSLPTNESTWSVTATRERRGLIPALMTRIFFFGKGPKEAGSVLLDRGKGLGWAQRGSSGREK